MITITRYNTLNSSVRALIELTIRKEFGHIPIVKQTLWSVPDWSVACFVEDELASFCNIIVREIRIDDRIYVAAGVSNVITLPQYRGRGFSTAILRATKDEIFKTLKADLGLLLCSDDLIPFYERSGWYQVDCPVYFNQEVGTRLWLANTMLLSRDEHRQPKEIDLQGLPW